MKIEERKLEISNLTKELRSLVDAKDVAGAKAKSEELRNAKELLHIEEEIETEEVRNLEKLNKEKKVEERKGDVKVEKEVRTQEQKDAMELRAIIKAVAGKPMNEEERALLATSGTNGEGYILPQTISTNIQKLIRSYKSFRDVIGYLPTNTLTGSFPIEGFESVSGLVDFAEDGTAQLSEATDIKFVNKSYALKEKGAFVALSNTLLQYTDQQLIAYVSEIFARKAVITENEMAVTSLKNGKTAKSVADWKALKKSLNVDLDPAVLANTVIVVNQDSFDVLDSALDSTGRPILQPNPANPTQMLFKGYPVVVFSNSLLPTTGTTTKKAPIIYGDLKDSVKFVDNGKYSFATSAEAGFLKNMTYARVIEYIDCIQVDSSDKMYIVGEMTV